MTKKIVLPKSGMGIEEATVIRWLKKIGEKVVQGEALVEIETAKATEEIEAPASGKLSKIFFAADLAAPVNSVLGEIEESE